ncbi:hypothetical protein Cgig2_000791 [Carnegiea gigantea]|uniref:ATPase AAA-type core domain-containing protein n=1 Tax=Carnegiea gigantea TaxID=171969 RepID=A0A9Q1GSW6_9CARY|nr:hypothetical protein Cgig2_000791 [Carnegiea gigantea]
MHGMKALQLVLIPPMPQLASTFCLPYSLLASSGISKPTSGNALSCLSRDAKRTSKWLLLDLCGPLGPLLPLVSCSMPRTQPPHETDLSQRLCQLVATSPMPQFLFPLSAACPLVVPSWKLLELLSFTMGVPLLYVPLEVVLSKYYGESERLLGKVFTLANELPDGAIIFLDEVDSFAIARDSEMHEATRRILSVLLRQIDGFEQDKRVVVIAATNRKQDLDPALISRFDSMITFGLPDQQNRQEIAAQYAKHLTKPELAEFAMVTEGLSGRDIRDVCQQAERRWASKAGDAKEGSLPPLQEYIESAMNRRKSLLEIEEQRSQNPGIRRDRRPLDLS